MMAIASMKSSIRGWERLCIPTRHDTNKGVSRLHADRDEYDCRYNRILLMTFCQQIKIALFVPSLPNVYHFRILNRANMTIFFRLVYYVNICHDRFIEREREIRDS